MNFAEICENQTGEVLYQKRIMVKLLKADLNLLEQGLVYMSLYLWENLSQQIIKPQV